MTVTAVEGAYRLEGTDDQCGGAADKASAIGTAFPNPDGTIGFGLTIVATPGGVPVHVDAALAAGQFDGTWRDSAGGSGQFVLTPGAGNGGNARPLPSAQVPATIGLRPDGSIVAGSTPNSPIPASGPGTRMMWHGGKGAFRAGRAIGTSGDDANVGQFSAAFGEGAVASGHRAFAAGAATASGSTSAAFGASQALGQFSFVAGTSAVASGPVSTAFGEFTRATGGASTALGYWTTASGPFSLAAGELATAQGPHAVALGYKTAALAKNSVVLGSNADASAAATGSFVFGDSSTPTVPGLQSYSPNEFVARFAGGYVFFSNRALTSGVYVAPGANAWASLSDVNSKENFRNLDDADVLAKIAAMPVREWNYKSQDAAIRHMGPTAQDFHAAFGLGEDPLRISTIDADGVALAAVKALEARTRALMDENAALRQGLEDLRAQVSAAAGGAGGQR